MKKSKYDYLLIEKENIVDMYVNKRMSSLDIAKIYNINASAVCYLLDKFDIKRRDNKNKSKFILNHNVFNSIDTKEKAYWLGFLFADGFITKDNYVGISLKNDDYKHLEKFRDFIESNHIIHTYKCLENSYSNPNNYYCKIIFKSEKMVEDLKNYGCIEHKSLVLQFPNNLKKEFYKDFIRGYFDGDGSLSFRKTNNKKSSDFKIAGTKEFLLKVIDILNQDILIEMSEKNLFKRFDNDKNSFYTSVSNNRKVKLFLDYIYKDSTIYLDRKFSKYLDFLNFL